MRVTLCVYFRIALGQLRQIMPPFPILFIFPLKTCLQTEVTFFFFLLWIKTNIEDVLPKESLLQIAYTDSNNTKPLHTYLVHLQCLLSGDISDTQLWRCAFTLVWAQVLYVVWLWTKHQRRQTMDIELFLFMPANTRGFWDHKYVVCCY